MPAMHRPLATPVAETPVTIRRRGQPVLGAEVCRPWLVGLSPPSPPGWPCCCSACGSAARSPPRSRAFPTRGRPRPGRYRRSGCSPTVSPRVTVGLLVTAAFLLPGDGRTVSPHGYLLLRRASLAAPGWAVAALSLLVLTVSDLLGQPLETLRPATVVSFATTISQGQSLLLQAGLALAVALLARAGVSRGLAATGHDPGPGRGAAAGVHRPLRRRRQPPDRGHQPGPARPRRRAVGRWARRAADGAAQPAAGRRRRAGTAASPWAASSPWRSAGWPTPRSASARSTSSGSPATAGWCSASSPRC